MFITMQDSFSLAPLGGIFSGKRQFLTVGFMRKNVYNRISSLYQKTYQWTTVPAPLPNGYPLLYVLIRYLS